MSFNSITRIAGSAMAAQTVRLNTIASNLANANTVSGSEEGAYRARKPVFSAAQAWSDADQMAGSGVRVLDVIESGEPVRRVSEPDNPLANAAGEVFYSNVNSVAEMTDMMAASRAFETNVDVLTRVKSMQQSLLRLGEG